MKRILLILSNVCPNEKSPKVAMELAKRFDAELYITFITDTAEHFEVNAIDHAIKKSEEQSVENIEAHGRYLLEKLNKEYEGERLKLVLTSRAGDFTNEIIKQAKEIAPELIIVGREQKECKVLGIFKKSIKSKIIKKSSLPILFIK